MQSLHEEQAAQVSEGWVSSLFSSTYFLQIYLPSPLAARPILQPDTSTRRRFLSRTTWPINAKTTRPETRMGILAAWRWCGGYMYVVS